MKKQNFILLVNFIIFFPIVNISADGSVPNKGSIPFKYYGYTQHLGGFDLEGSFDWEIKGAPPVGQRDTSIAGRIMDDPYFNWKFNVKNIGTSFYYEGKSYDINAYPELKDVSIYSSTISVNLVSGSYQYAFEPQLLTFSNGRDHDEQVFIEVITKKDSNEIQKMAATNGFYLQGFSFRKLVWWNMDNFKNRLSDESRKASQARTFLNQAQADMQAGRYPEAQANAKKAIELDPSLQTQAMKLVNDADQKEKLAIIAKNNEVQKAQSSNPSSSSSSTAYTPASPPAESKADYVKSYIAEQENERQAREASINNLFNSIDEYNRQQAQQIQDANRWSAATKLNASASPESMIRDAEAKKQELERLSQQKKEAFDKEIADEQAKNSSDETAQQQLIMGAFASVVKAVGNSDIENQKRKAQEDIDNQLTAAFKNIQSKLLSNNNSNLAIAYSGMAKTIYPEEFEYFKEVSEYYSAFNTQINSGFTTSDTSWIHPDGAPPREPRMQRNLNFSDDTMASLLEEKWGFYNSNTQYRSGTAESILVLSRHSMKVFPDLPDGYYYCGLLTTDSLSKWMLLQEAKEKSDGRSDISSAFSVANTQLSASLFTAIAQNDSSFISRIWSIGLGRDFRNNYGQDPYYAALLVNTASLKTLLDNASSDEKSRVPQSLLIVAAADGKNDAIAILTTFGGDPLKADEAGITPILAAADKGHLDTIGLLVKQYSADPMESLSKAQATGMTSAVYYLGIFKLSDAFAEENIEVAKILIGYRKDLPLAVQSGKTSFLAASVTMDKPKMLTLFLENPQFITYKNVSGDSLLSLAMRANASDEIFKVLAEGGALKCKGTVLPLQYAVVQGRVPLTQYLLSQGEDPNEKGPNGSTSLHLAIIKNQPTLIPLLLTNKADPLIADDEGQTSLHKAAQLLDANSFKAILGSSKPGLYVDKAGRTPLFEAVQWDRPESAKALIGLQPDLSLQDNQGRTALLQAMFTCPALAPELFCEKNSFNVPDNNGDTPLAIAIRTDQLDWAQTLIAGGAELNRKDKLGMAPVHWAALSANPQIQALLLEPGADLLLKDKHGSTPLHILLNRGSPGLAKTLVEKRSLPGDIADEMGNTLLDLAIKKGLDDTALLLIKNSERLDQQEMGTGSTALHLAAQAGDQKIVAALLNSGASKNIRDWKGKTPQDLAYEAKSKVLGDYIKNWKKS